MKNIFLLLFVLFIPVFSFAANFSVGKGFKAFTDTLSNSNRFDNKFCWNKCGCLQDYKNKCNIKV